MAEFAKAQLLKYGWTEGKGLGKNENGISVALKPKLKFDLSGIGHKETNFEWWNSAYDKAQKNIIVEKQSDEVCFTVAKENAFNISTSEFGLEVPKKKQNYEYGKFLKTSTLHNGKVIKENPCEIIENESVIDQSTIQMTDEELFEACGGRTAHKGARHGLTSSGKLARVAEQEKQLLGSIFSKSNEMNVCCKKNKEKKKSKRKKKSELNNVLKNEYASDENDIPILKEQEEKPILTKSARKSLKKNINNLTNQLSKSFSIEDNSNEKNGEISSHNDEAIEKCESKAHKVKSKKKSKRKRNTECLDSADENPLEDDVDMKPIVKKLKKSKVDPLVLDLFFTKQEQEEQAAKMNETKTSKKKSKKGGTKKLNSTFCCTSSNADMLNTRISIKKERKLKRKEHRKIEELSKNLLSINLSSDSTINDVTEKIKSSKKSKKKKKKKGF